MDAVFRWKASSRDASTVGDAGHGADGEREILAAFLCRIQSDVAHGFLKSGFLDGNIPNTHRQIRQEVVAFAVGFSGALRSGGTFCADTLAPATTASLESLINPVRLAVFT